MKATYPDMGAPGSEATLARPWLFRSDSVSVTMIGSPMTMVPVNAIACETSSTDDNSTYAILVGR